MKTNLENKIKQFNAIIGNIKTIPQLVDKVVSDNKDVILSLNRDQLLYGRNTDGVPLSPNYLQDPYFKTKAQAESYARMKYALEAQHKSRLWEPVQLFPEKGRDIPNLIVTGTFQDSMFITTGSGKYNVGASYSDTSDIDRKYKGKVFGLALQSRNYFFTEYIKAKLIRSLYGL